MRIIQVSDTHLSTRHGFFAANNTAIRDWVAAQQADLIIHTGDVGMDAAVDPVDLGLASVWTAGFPAPMLAVPGNHDVNFG